MLFFAASPCFLRCSLSLLSRCDGPVRHSNPFPLENNREFPSVCFTYDPSTLPPYYHTTTQHVRSSVPARPRAAAIRRSSRGAPSPAAPSRTIQPASVLTRTGQPDPRHICTLAVALSRCPHTHDSSHHGMHVGPLALSSCTATVLAHGPVLGPALPHRHPSCPAAPQTGTSRTILHPGQCSTSPPQPGAALRLIAPPLFGAALVHACLHRCTPRTASLSMRSAAPCARRSTYRAHGAVDRRTHRIAR